MAGKKTISTVTPAIGAIAIQQSTYGLVLPIIWGRTRVSGNLIWYGDFKAVPHTEVTQSGGKGGGAPRQTTTTYTYTASVAMALCEGPIVGIRTAWRGKKIYGGTSYVGVNRRESRVFVFNGDPIYSGVLAGWSDISVERQTAEDFEDTYRNYRKGSYVPLIPGVDYTAVNGVYTFASGRVALGETLLLTYTFTSTDSGSSVLSALHMDLFPGTPGQAAWPYLTSWHPDQALNYSSIAYLAAANYSLDDGASVENHAFEIESGFTFSTTIHDANPAVIVVDAMSNPQYGARFGAEKIASLDDYAAACTAQGIFLSPALTEQSSAAQFLESMAALTNVGMVWSGGVLKFVPYTDMPMTGNGVTFTPNTAPIYDLTDDDFQPGDETGPVKVNRGAVGDTFNQVNIEFLDRANAYNIGIMPATDQADIQENGLRTMPTIKAHWITEASVAKIVATLILQRSMFVRNTYEFKLGWTKIALEPMDLVTLTDPVLMTKQPVRILTIEEDEGGYLDIVAEDFPKGSASATLYPSASGAGFAHDQNESPGTLGAPVIFEAPAALTDQAGGLEVWLAAGNNGATYGGCEIWVSLTGSNYQRAAVINGASRFGVTTSDLAATPGTTTETVGVQLTAGGQLLTGTIADMNALSTLCYVDGEFLGYETSVLTGGSAYTLGNHMLRGAYLSAPAAHASGSAFVRCDEAVARMPLSPDYIGKTLHIKVLPFNRYGGGIGDLASAVEYTYTVTGAQANNPPVAPTGLALEGAFTISTAKFKWNRVSNAASYNVQTYIGLTKVREVNVGDALRFDYSSADAKVDGGPWRELTIKVQGIHANGAPGAFSVLSVSNPQVSALTGISARGSMRSVRFACSRPADPDFYGIMVCLSTVSGFVPGNDTLVYDGPNTSLTISELSGSQSAGVVVGLAYRNTRNGAALVYGDTSYRDTGGGGAALTNGVTYYLRAAAYDTFDRLGLAWSAEYAVTPTAVEIPADSIGEDKLVAALRARLSLIDGPATAEGTVQARVKAETDARVAAIQAEIDARIQALLAETGARTTYVQSYTYSKAETESALSIQATQVAAYADARKGEAIAAAAADVRNYSYSKANVDSAEAAQLTAITTSYTSYADAMKLEAISTASADVRSYSYSKATTDSAIASTADQLRADFAASNGATTAYVQSYAYSKAQVDSAEAAQSNALTTDYQGYADNRKSEAIAAAAADVRSYSYSKAALDGAFASQSSTLTAAYTAYANGKRDEAISVSSADVRSYAFSKAEVNSAVASSTSTVSARLDNISGSGVTVEQKISAQANSITGLAGQAVLAVDVNNVITGVKIAGTASSAGATSDVTVMADTFKVVSTSASAKTMFAVAMVNGVTEITLNGNVHADQGITTRTIADDALSDGYAYLVASTSAVFLGLSSTAKFLISCQCAFPAGTDSGFKIEYMGIGGSTWSQVYTAQVVGAFTTLFEPGYPGNFRIIGRDQVDAPVTAISIVLLKK